MVGLISENNLLKKYRSSDYNYSFNKKTGLFIRWGKSLKDDPIMAPLPEILDIEVTTICNNGCPFCYKSNTSNGKNMSLDTFKAIMERFVIPQDNSDKKFYAISQIAYGADAFGTSNPDLFPMMEYARSIGVIPNITIADISDDIADKLVSLCGAVAVSRYKNKNKCYDSVKKLTDRGLNQTNIHLMLSSNTLDQVWETLNDYKTDPRLSKLNAIVLLSLKKKGRGINHEQVTQEEFNKIVDYALENKIPFGFDSCSYHKFIEATKDKPNAKQLEMVAEPCESFGLFSSYINVDGRYFPCSFCEQVNEDWQEGIDVLSVSSFSDIWNSEIMNKYRNMSLSCNRKCLVYDI